MCLRVQGLGCQRNATLRACKCTTGFAAVGAFPYFRSAGSISSLIMVELTLLSRGSGSEKLIPPDLALAETRVSPCSLLSSSVCLLNVMF